MLKIFLFIPFFAGYMCFAQQFTGIIKDQESHRSIPFVDIQLVEFDIQNTADSNGVFNISGKLPKSVVVQITAKGYETKVVKLICCDQITVTLEPDLHDLNEVKITAQSKDLNGSKTQKTDYLAIKKDGDSWPIKFNGFFRTTRRCATCILWSFKCKTGYSWDARNASRNLFKWDAC